MGTEPEWEAKKAFESMSDYRSVAAWVAEQVKAAKAVPVPVESPYSGSTLWDEHWFRNLETGTVWRLVAPDPPFRGIFKPVT